MIPIVLLPFITWFITGCIKFAITTIRIRHIDFNKIGYGGFPSNHSSIVCSTTSYLIFSYGLNDPVSLAAITFSFIIMLDAVSLRNQIGKQAKEINGLIGYSKLRERIGHSRLEIFGGAIVGSIIGWTFFIL